MRNNNRRVDLREAYQRLVKKNAISLPYIKPTIGEHHQKQQFLDEKGQTRSYITNFPDFPAFSDASLKESFNTPQTDDDRELPEIILQMGGMPIGDSVSMPSTQNSFSEYPIDSEYSIEPAKKETMPIDQDFTYGSPDNFIDKEKGFNVVDDNIKHGTDNARNRGQ